MTANTPISITPTELAQMLRKSADIVERNEFHPLLYQTMKVLTAYAADYADNGSGVVAANHHTQPHASAFHDVPDSVLDGPTRSNHVPSRPQSGHSSGNSVSSSATAPSTTTAGGSSKVKPSAFSLKGIKKGLQKIGGEFSEFITDKEGHEHHHAAASSSQPDEYAWCDEHFTRGCGCKLRNKEKETTTTSTTTHAQQTAPSEEKSNKPCFQRPINPSSNLIANGWIDQQRRSKMRIVWKEVLASLVEGRRPGEETTLWIQRQIVDATTGKVTGLEALHQVPMKWLEDVNYVDIYGDCRFTLKVYNIAEEFYFRTRDEASAQSWVLTLRSARDVSLENSRMKGFHGGEEEEGNLRPNGAEVRGMMGLNNLEDWDTASGSVAAGKHPQQPAEESGRPSSAPSSTQTTAAAAAAASTRMTISELRSIAHGAGYDTRGMERQDLERIYAMVRGQASVAPSSSPAPDDEQEQRVKEAEEEFMKQKMELDKRRAAAAAAEEQRRRQEEEERQRQEQQAAELRRKEEAERQRQLEEQRRRQEAERQQEEQRRRQEAERQQEEQRRRQEEERQRQLLEQQIAQNKQRQEEERRKRVAELQAAEMKRNQEEERRKQQQQAQQQQQYYQQQQQQQQQAHHHQQQQQQHAHYQQHNQHQQNQQYYTQNHQQGYHQQGFHGHQQPQQQHQQQQFYNQSAPPPGNYPQQGFHGHAQPQPQQRPQQQQPQQPQQQTSGAQPTSKYMEDKDGEAQSAATLKIKRNILIHWALQPPNLNVLRPIDQLITTIHTAMPPAYGVPTHDYFTKFTPITRHEILAPGNHPDETKLKKAVRKVRVFLHPDKLPRDLSADQSFMARMLWDITSDSWEEFLKHKDELDWIRS